MSWITVKASEVKEKNILIRQVKEGFEWVPGPYGAFVVVGIEWRQDEVVFTLAPCWGGKKRVKVSYDGDEKVVVKKNHH